MPLTSATPLHQEMALGAVLPRLPFSASFPRLLSWPVPGMKPSLLKLDCAAASRLNSNGHEVLVLNTHAAKLNAVRAKTQYAANEQPQRINNSPANVTGAMAAAAWYYKTLKNRPSDLKQLLRDARQWASTDYAAALMKGDALSRCRKVSDR